MDKNTEIKKTFTQKITVSPSQTAEYLGSGLLPVYATPALVTLMENTAMQIIQNEEGKTSVGISMQINHIKASVIDEIITCTAELIKQEGRKYIFSAIATNKDGDIIGNCIHERILINIEKFMSKLNN
jgi:predicted thioesterase